MFVRGLLGYLPANAIQALVGLGAIALFTRLLSPAEYGAYALAFSAMSLAHTVFFTWMEAAMARFWVRAAADGEGADHLATLYRAWLLAAAPFTALCLGGIAFWPGAAPLKAAMGAALAAILTRSLVKLAQERRRAAGQVGAAAGLDMFQNLGGFGVGLLLVVVGAAGAGVIAGLAAAAAAALVWVLPTELAAARPGRFDGARAGRYFAFGYPVAASLILSAVLAAADRFILAGVLGERGVGAYHAAYSLASRTLDVIFIWLGMAGGPAMVAALERGGRPALLRAARRQAELMIVIAVPAAVGLALVAEPLARLMIGPDLRGAVVVVTPWIIAAAFFSGMTTYYLSTAFTLARRTGLMTAALGVAAASNIALNLWLAPRFGLAGAAMAATASFGLGAAASLALGRIALPLPLPVATLVKALAASAAMAAAVRLVPVLAGPLEILVMTATGVLAYSLAALVLDLAGCRAILATAARRVLRDRLERVPA